MAVGKEAWLEAGGGREKRGGKGSGVSGSAGLRGAARGCAMRLTQSMCTIAECAPGGEGCPAARPRLVKIAVVGGSGVGKTGEADGRGENGGQGGGGARLTLICACPQRSWCGS